MGPPPLSRIVCISIRDPAGLSMHKPCAASASGIGTWTERRRHPLAPPKSSMELFKHAFSIQPVSEQEHINSTTRVYSSSSPPAAATGAGAALGVLTVAAPFRLRRCVSVILSPRLNATPCVLERMRMWPRMLPSARFSTDTFTSASSPEHITKHTTRLIGRPMHQKRSETHGTPGHWIPTRGDE